MRKFFYELKEAIKYSLNVIGQSVQSGNWQ